MSKCADILGASVFTVDGEIEIWHWGRQERTHGVGIEIGGISINS